MKYTVHLGRRESEWPAQIASAGTRSEAQRLAADALGSAPASPPHKAEVRLEGGQLLDAYGRRGGNRVYHAYEARQRTTNPNEES